MYLYKLARSLQNFMFSFENRTVEINKPKNPYFQLTHFGRALAFFGHVSCLPHLCTSPSSGFISGNAQWVAAKRAHSKSLSKKRCCRASHTLKSRFRVTCYVAERERGKWIQNRSEPAMGRSPGSVGEGFAMATLASSCRGGSSDSRGKEDTSSI